LRGFPIALVLVHRAAPLAAVALIAVACTGEIGVPGGAAPGSVEACDAEGAVESCFPDNPVFAGVGECKVGTSTCRQGAWSGCEGHQGPEVERCDELDNSCDGIVDEGCGCDTGDARECFTGPGSTVNLGMCHGGLQHCVSGSWAPECDGEVVPQPEACDTLDNNCDGVVDDGCSCVDGNVQPCYTGPGGTQGVGPCAAGSQTCAGGLWLACAGEVTPQGEGCNGQDDDCDGSTDEGNPGGGGSCSTGQPGPCAAGTLQCSGGGLTCAPNTGPIPEVCSDGVDNDCNGQVDDGCSCSHGICSTGGPLVAGCDGCVTQICAADPFCCSTSWDNTCVGETQSVCGTGSCAVSCPHSLCDAGPADTPFWSGCDSPGGCVSQVCSADDYCCSTDWDSVCVGEVGSVCGLGC
jgi:hypothetical protein